MISTLIHLLPGNHVCQGAETRYSSELFSSGHLLFGIIQWYVDMKVHESALGHFYHIIKGTDLDNYWV